ncbi:RcnB family protein [Brevundimonas sp.]|uniref:RcnB family protein n=1 Tax=Brevundimonas sp. TaxID=1871086 RepID=UPI0025D688F2|nr:RcnB family protein [Brevundimonas sp.]
MKKFLTAAVALSVLAGTAGVADAQQYRGDGDGDRYESRYDRRDDRRDDRYDRRDDRRDDRYDRREDRREDRWERRAERRYYAGRYQAPRGYYQRQWRRGDHVPSHWRTRAYVVDHRRYGLSAPPRGYQYTRVGNDVVLTAIATGVIASVIFGLFQ